ncbi:trypco2 family protein [Streptomyces sp. NPDC003247]|uniref:trypco2 family protein n=1 Tax=Streptomyces sp. NPDC003247 TaxID=3364677 RepID=UPI00367FB033
MPEELELTAAVRLVRDALLSAAADTHDDLRFEVGPVGMEFTVELRRDVAAKTGFRAWVLSGDAEARAGRTRTHKVSLTLTPKRADGRAVEISRNLADGHPADGGLPGDDGGADDGSALFLAPDAS